MDRCKAMMERPERTEPRGPADPGRDGRLVIVGARRHLRRLARGLDHGPWSGVPVVGFVDLSGRGRQLAVHPGSDPVPILGPIDRLAELVDRSGATHLIVALSGRRARRLHPQLSDLARSSVRIHWITEDACPPEAPPPSTRRPATHRAPWPLRCGRLGKRLVDVLAAGVGLVLLAPLFAVVAALILATDGHPIFYLQERVGPGGRTFRIWKFRSMRRNAEGETGPIWATYHDDRCTRIGDWMRRTNIDELPQLINVALGQMSLVGPRPERPVFVERFKAEIPDYELRHAVPVGMTGWAQVHGWRGRTSLRKRVQYDLDYIRRWSFWLDFRILLMTVQHVVRGKTSWGEPRRRPDA
jgi:exopolysaccharide biosynthesis polyprenyl glycosylphosphotransferase